MSEIHWPAGVSLASGEKTGTRAVTIRSHLPEVEPRPGLLCLCCDCDGESFALWQIIGQTNLHIQCVGCGAVYCVGHDCAREAAEAAVAGRPGPEREPAGDDVPPIPETEGGGSCLIV